jgi:hypothetical protein
VKKISSNILMTNSMQISRISKIAALILSVGILSLARSAQAVCPVCTIAVASCVGLSQYLGIDDAVAGVWIGGFTVSLIAWTIDYLNRKNIRFYGRKILVILAMYIMVVWPLQYKELIGHPSNKLWGFDKLLLGIFAGSVFFIFGNIANWYLKKKNGGRVYFPFQKVVLPVAFLAILSGVFYWLTC